LFSFLIVFLSGRPLELLREALVIAPQDEKALELMGIYAYQQREYSTAAYYWRQLLKILPPDSPYAKDIETAAQEARTLAHTAAFGEIRTIKGTVRLADEALSIKNSIISASAWHNQNLFFTF
jgi:tetratricopeptide (TPR) repeat protein